MNRFLPNFLAKKAIPQVDELDLQAQAALQMRVLRMMQQGDVSVSP